VANEEEEGEEEAPPLEGAQQCEVSSIAAASEGEGEGASAVVDDSTWMKVDAREVRVFGRPFLGFGSFATVRRGQWMGVPVAVKFINKQKKGQYVRGLKRELKMWWPVRHPHVTSLYGAFENESYVYIVMERLHLNMNQAVECLPHTQVLKNCKRWATQIASAMHFLHARGILHRDLKLHNILLTRDLKSCKIADFGTAVEEHEADNIIVGTTEYMAPGSMHVFG